ncbi:hypothetical protein [Bowmanella dokdonensis]|uniref:PEP-CTERM protein-sorting domain-containing protein n=1 Tax=Bowmanella dokdonensis TaxID=751969 RepID=A0A939DLX1_9ALTE|nr:hypothetical protein [Bowmanella dokdonensis]MBN7825168.1 hypothetical protein [Bowmanella dokdonensis]
MFKKVMCLFGFALVSMQSHAALIWADFKITGSSDGESADLVVYQNFNQSIGIGLELGAANLTSRNSLLDDPQMTVDLNLANLLQVTTGPFEELSGTFQKFELSIFNIVFSEAGESLSALSLLADSDQLACYFDYLDWQSGCQSLIPSLSFGQNFLTITWEHFENTFSFNPEQSMRFQIGTSIDNEPALVSEPAALLIFSFALVLMGYNRRKFLQ